MPRRRSHQHSERTPEVPPSRIDLREAWLSAFQRIGGVARLAEWADENPSAFFNHLSKMLPREEKIEQDTRIIVEWADGTIQGASGGDE